MLSLSAMLSYLYQQCYVIYTIFNALPNYTTIIQQKTNINVCKVTYTIE